MTPLPAHLDLATTPVVDKGDPARPSWRTVFEALTLPLFFVVMFSVCYISAFHAPQPHDAPLVIVGAAEQTSAVIDAIEEESPDGFDLTSTTSAESAIDSIKSRDAMGAIELGETVTVYVATGAGASTVSLVKSVAQTIADESALDVEVTDLAPVPDGDASATGLFYMLIICTIGGYLTVTILGQAVSGLKLSRKYAVLGGAAVVTPLIIFGIASIFQAWEGASAEAILAMLAIAVAYTFTVGVISIVADQLIGPAAIFLVAAIAIFLNFPSSGGAIALPLLPEFWQWMHSFWLGSGAMESMRSVIYFDGNGAGEWIAHLGIWLGTALLLSGIVHFVKLLLARSASAVQFPKDLIERARLQAKADDRTLSGWMTHTIANKLEQNALTERSDTADETPGRSESPVTL